MKKLYIIAHELSHYFMAVFFRRKVSQFSFKSKEAFVEIENPNFFILMAPYILPLWCVVIVALKLIFSSSNRYIGLGLDIALCISFAHHCVMTCYALSFDQKDLKKYGRLRSLLFIIMFNLSIIYFSLAINELGFLESFRFIYLSLKSLGNSIG